MVVGFQLVTLHPRDRGVINFRINFGWIEQCPGVGVAVVAERIEQVLPLAGEGGGGWGNVAAGRGGDDRAIPKQLLDALFHRTVQQFVGQ